MTTYIGAPISPELARELDEFFTKVRESETPLDHRAEGVDLILRMTRENLNFYFLRSVEELGVGALTRKGVAFGLDTSMRGISVFVKATGRALSAEQIVKLTHLVEELVLEVEDDEAE